MFPHTPKQPAGLAQCFMGSLMTEEAKLEMVKQTCFIQRSGMENGSFATLRGATRSLRPTRLKLFVLQLLEMWASRLISSRLISSVFLLMLLMHKVVRISTFTVEMALIY